jgi:pimeloyl-ACP methyl ester carboxylesterase
MRAVAHEMPDIQARCKQLTLPVHVLYDHADRVLDAQLQGARLPERLPHARVAFIENGGHMLPITQSQHCVNLVRQLLQDIESVEHEAT